jgi:N-ethylmaleimide reductase
MPSLFDPVQFGALALQSRIVMAPLTRNRAVGPGQVPNALMAEYYAQRARPATGAALIISEAAQISAEGRGWRDTPGLHSAEQVQGWREVTAAVHAAGGLIVAQLWHVGRVSHADLHGGAGPVSSTARVAAGRKAFTDAGLVPSSPPRALADEELPRVVADYVAAARNAIAAGFDGVEVHAANGYLLDQFLRDTVNDRDPRHSAYGGSIAARCRLTLEVMQAVAAAVGAPRCGIRLSPGNPTADAAPDSQAQALFEHLIREMAALPLAFIHMIEGQTGGAREAWPIDYAALRRCARPGSAWLVNNGYSRADALEAVATGRADAVAFGKPFIANPDLTRRLRVDAPLAMADASTYYFGGARGYVDYPVWPGGMVA